MRYLRRAIILLSLLIHLHPQLKHLTPSLPINKKISPPSMKFSIASVTVLVLSVVMTMTSAAALPAVLAADVDEVPRCCPINGQMICGVFGPRCPTTEEALSAGADGASPHCCIIHGHVVCGQTESCYVPK